MTDSRFIFDVNEDTFQSLVLDNSANVPVLLDFWAAWCGPCQMLIPILEKLVHEYQGKFILAKANADEQAPLAARYGVRSLPAVKLFRHGEVVDEFLGAQPESVVREIVDRHIERPSDKIAAAALQALQRGDLPSATELMAQATALDPDTPRLRIDQARILLASGDYTQAEAAMRGLPADLAAGNDVVTLKALIEFGRIAADAPDVKALEATLAGDPVDIDASYALAAHKVLLNDYEGAMDLYLDIMRRDRSFRDDAARKRLLDVFNVAGDKSELVSRYRTRMSRLLY